MARLKTTDVYEKLQKNHDPELVKILAAIVERMNVQHSQILSCAEGINKVMDCYIQLSTVAGNLSQATELMRKKLGFKDNKSVVESYEEKDDDPSPTS